MKFKIWDKEQKRFIEREVAKDYFIDQHGNILFSNGHCLSNVNSIFEPVYSTENIDRDSVELFDGDIIEYEGMNYEIHCARGTYGISTKRGFQLLSMISGRHLPKIKKIGSKLENPELVSEPKKEETQDEELTPCPKCKRPRGVDEDGAYICPLPSLRMQDSFLRKKPKTSPEK